MARDYLSEKFEVIKLYNYRVYVWLILEFLLWWIFDVLENSSNKRLELKSVIARNNLWDLFGVWYSEINMKRRGYVLWEFDNITTCQRFDEFA